MKYLPPELVSIIRQYAGVRPDVLTYYKQVLKEMVTHEKIIKAKCEEKGIYYYHFAVQPRGDPPPGSVSFSRLDSVNLRLKIWAS